MSSLPEDYNDAAMLGLLIVVVIYNLYSLVIVIVNAYVVIARKRKNA